MKKAARRWFVSGTVQGVGFRFFAQAKAASIGVTGWARNLDDGRVEIYAIGSEEQLDALAGALHIGPRSAEVRAVEQQDAPVESTSSFRIR
jgi:acylphosphatase